jgi:hypothetical protein
VTTSGDPSDVEPAGTGTGRGRGEPGRSSGGDPAEAGSGDARGTIDRDEGGESPCLAHLVDDPPALPDGRLAELVGRLADATSRAGRDGIDRA